MSNLLHAHAGEMERFLLAIRSDRITRIAEVKSIHRILAGLGVSKDEQRPFTDPEIESVLERYKHFQTYFKEKGLWPELLDGDCPG